MSNPRLHIDGNGPIISLSLPAPTNHLLAPDLGSEIILREKLEPSRQAPRSLGGYSKRLWAGHRSRTWEPGTIAEH